MIPIEKLISICCTIYDKPGMFLVGQIFKTYCTETHGFRSFLMMESLSAFYQNEHAHVAPPVAF
jgi:hypothetical protein